jgi:hypothetical protein
VEVRYLAPHAALASDEDVSTVPETAEDLLLALAAFRVVGSLATEEAKRQRFEGRTGQTAGTAADFYRRQYEEGVRSRRTGVRARRLAVR